MRASRAAPHCGFFEASRVIGSPGSIALLFLPGAEACLGFLELGRRQHAGDRIAGLGGVGCPARAPSPRAQARALTWNQQ